MPFERISILGVGLLGGSIGLALKSLPSTCHIVGYGHRDSTLQKAVEFGAIDRGTTDLAEAAKECDLAILCTPVGLFELMLQGLRSVLRPGAVVTDVGSTKRSVVRLAESMLPEGVRFVGSHPMAGSEKRGVEFARTDLFQNALCIVTPTGRTDADALEAVEGFWRSMGMKVARTTPEEHDRLLAEVSHLPHALASALVLMQEEAGLKLAGKGFLDTTRVAGGDGELWRDILLDNQDNVGGAIARLKEKLGELEGLLEGNRGAELAAWLNGAAKRREALLREKLTEL